MIECPHTQHVADPDRVNSPADQFRVCLDCGACLVKCHYCPALYVDVTCYGSPGFCPQHDGCEQCCAEQPGALTRDDTATAILAACDSVANGYRWKTVRLLPPEQRLAWIKGEFSNGGSFGGRLSFDGFRASATRGKGLWAQVRHRTGVITWQQILNFVEASEVCASVCLECGVVSEKLSVPPTRCEGCYGSNLVMDPHHDGWAAYSFVARSDAKTVASTPQLSLF